LIGRKYSDFVVQNDTQLCSFKVIAGVNDKPTILVNYNQQEDTFVFVDFLKELESIFESAMNEINKGYSDEESDTD